jgi:hypothetical protein
VRRTKFYAFALYRLSELGAAVIVKEVVPLIVIQVTAVVPAESQTVKVRSPQLMLAVLSFALSDIV